MRAGAQNAEGSAGHGKVSVHVSGAGQLQRELGFLSLPVLPLRVVGVLREPGWRVERNPLFCPPRNLPLHIHPGAGLSLQNRPQWLSWETSLSLTSTIHPGRSVWGCTGWVQPSWCG